ncbi:hypothetical protein H2203_000300 [Taxawa tesnikishii (nom. ined.)]|nr:hypothetical protein H2203_000300 [Dothideales sp. JES 119]
MAHSITQPSSCSPRAASCTIPSVEAYDSQFAYSNYTESVNDGSPYSSPFQEVNWNPTSLSPSSRYSSPTRSITPQAIGSRLLSAWSDNVKLPPAVAATANTLKRSTSLHVRAKTIAGFVPSLTPTVDEDETAPSSPGKQFRNALGDFFSVSGSSAPVQLGVRTALHSEESEDEADDIMEYRPALTAIPARSPLRPTYTPESTRKTAPEFPRRKSSLSAHNPNLERRKSSTASRFSWFSKPTYTTAPSTPNPQEPEDEFVNLNITSALFPNGSVDPLDPASFNNLLLNAESLIKRMQAAYKEKCDALRHAQAEREAAVEEAEESETRARHLKMQLDEMACKATQQDRAMQALADELAAEKQQRQKQQQQQQQQQQQIRVVGGGGEETGRESASDSGFESDSENGSECWTPESITSPNPLSYEAERQRWGIKPLKPSSTREILPQDRRGADANAWGVVTSLRLENNRLEGRVRELEGAVESCLDLVHLMGN